MNRKRIQADYERRLDANGKESYVYTGPRYSLDLAPEKLRRFRLLCWTVPFVGLAIFVLMGLLDTGSTRVFYIALPFVSLFMPLCLMVGDAYKITVSRGNMERKEYGRSVVQMRRCTIACLVLSAYVLIAQAFYMLLGSGAVAREELYFLFGAALMAALSFFFLWIQRRVPTAEHR